MRYKILFSIVIASLIVGCSTSLYNVLDSSQERQIDSNIGEKVAEDINPEEAVNASNDTIKESLKAYNLPLQGDNVFDPKVVSIGEIINGLELIDIEVEEATEYYPFDTVVASFRGEKTLTGTIQRTGLEGEWLLDKVIFIADEASSKQLPVSHHDIRKVDIPYTYILFDNQSEIKKQINTIPGESIENIRIRAKDFKTIYIPSTVIDSITFIEIID